MKLSEFKVGDRIKRTLVGEVFYGNVTCVHDNGALCVKRDDNDNEDGSGCNGLWHVSDEDSLSMGTLAERIEPEKEAAKGLKLSDFRVGDLVRGDSYDGVVQCIHDGHLCVKRSDGVESGGCSMAWICDELKGVVSSSITSFRPPLEKINTKTPSDTPTISLPAVMAGQTFTVKEPGVAEWPQDSAGIQKLFEESVEFLKIQDRKKLGEWRGLQVYIDNNPLTPKNMGIVKWFTDLSVKQPHKTWRKLGLEDEDGLPTDEGMRLYTAWKMKQDGDIFHKEVTSKYKPEKEEI